MRKRIGIVILTAILGIMPVLTVSATTSNEVKEMKKDTEKKLNSINSDIDSIEADKTTLEEEIEEIDAQLVDMLMTVSLLQDDIRTKDIMIDNAQVAYDEAKDREETQYEAMKKRIKFMYEKGDQSYLDMFLQSASISDLLNKVDYVEKLYSYDRELLLEYQATKEEVLKLKNTLEEEKSELEEVQADYVEQSDALQALIDEKKSSVENFEDQLAVAKDKASKYQQELKEQNAMIKQLEAEEAARRAEEARKKKEAEEAARRKAQEEAAAASAKKKAEENAKKEATKSNDDDSDDEDNQESESSESSDYEEEHEEEERDYDSDPGDSSLGREIADYASQFVGNPYVAGGTSLTDGADCSGFTMAVYSHFGISLPRSSYSQSTAGREVSYSEVQPGDILYYGGHVGIYVGNGTIVHASTASTGIKFSNALYRSVITVRRFV